MNATIKVYLTISILLSCTELLWASQSRRDSIIFSGNLSDKNLGKIAGTIYINYDPDDWFFYAGNSKHLSQKTDASGNFRFSLPDLKKPYKINILIRKEDKTKLWSGSFYADSDDNVRMHLAIDNNKQIITFDGNGKENYKLAFELDRQYWEDYRSKLSVIKINSFSDLQELDSKIERLSVLLKDFIRAKQHKIEISTVNNRMKEILMDEFAWYKNEWSNVLFNLFKKHSVYSKHIYKKYMEQNYVFDHPLNKSSIYCPIYMSMASNRIVVESIMRNDENKIDIISHYNVVKAKYVDILRDRLIGLCFFSAVTLSQFKPYSYDVMDSLLADAEKIVVDIPVKSAISLKRITLAKINKSKIINASFSDLNGKPFDLKSLRGKVILIDTWFNGCIGCAGFHRDFEQEIFPKFKRNPGFVMLAINVDKKQEDWRKGIATGHYTSNDYINVNTGNGIGFEHPFTKYYNIKGSPTLMLIDADGNIIYQPPLGVYTTAELIFKIQEALDKLGNDI